MVRLRLVGIRMKEKFPDPSDRDSVNLINELQKARGRGERSAAKTINDFKVALKRFYRWQFKKSVEREEYKWAPWGIKKIWKQFKQKVREDHYTGWRTWYACPVHESTRQMLHLTLIRFWMQDFWTSDSQNWRRLEWRIWAEIACYRQNRWKDSKGSLWFCGLFHGLDKGTSGKG